MEQWSRHFFHPSTKVDHITNNMTESFNGWLGVNRCKPLVTMFEQIRIKLMKRMVKGKNRFASWKNEITPEARELINNNIEDMNSCTVASGGLEIYNVVEYCITHKVDLNTHYCTCGVWQVSGIPCRHAIVVICDRKEKFDTYVSPFFIKTYYLWAYDKGIIPIEDEIYWILCIKDNPIYPPIVKRKLGRPKLNRRRGQDEGPDGTRKRKNSYMCHKCGGFGHNISTCDRVRSIVAKKKSTSKRMRGNGTSSRGKGSRGGKGGSGVTRKRKQIAPSQSTQHSQVNTE